jgi:cell division protein ZapA
MASVEIMIADRKYQLACRDGEEAHLRSVAALVDRKARDAGAAVGNMTEARQLLFAALLLADELQDQRAGKSGGAAPQPDPAVADALERLAEKVEAVADRLESPGTSH